MSEGLEQVDRPGEGRRPQFIARGVLRTRWHQQVVVCAAGVSFAEAPDPGLLFPPGTMEWFFSKATGDDPPDDRAGRRAVH